jgi:hypothetical protein
MQVGTGPPPLHLVQEQTIQQVVYGIALRRLNELKAEALQLLQARTHSRCCHQQDLPGGHATQCRMRWAIIACGCCRFRYGYFGDGVQSTTWQYLSMHSTPLYVSNTKSGCKVSIGVPHLLITKA